MREVVAVAIVRNGELLAARRTYPAALAGRWELPGGKVEPGETLEHAAVREIREELGCGVEVTGVLEESAPVGDGLLLRVATARLVQDGGEPVPTEHDELRWLGPENLCDVDWLDGDRPFLDGLADRLLDGVPLPGGNVGGAVRVGDTVRRPVGPWTPAVHALLGHLRRAGLRGVPRVHGTDARGREILDFLPGTVVDVDRSRLSDAQLVSAVEWLRDYHAAVTGFGPSGPLRWRFENTELSAEQLICHNDFATYNLAFDGERLSGVFDWDVSGPGLPIDDLAFFAWNSIPLFRDVGPDDAARRLALVSGAYGGPAASDILNAVVLRMTAATDRIERGQRDGDEGMLNLGAAGEPARTRARLDRLKNIVPSIAAALPSEFRRNGPSRA